jgi:hypothetical protein
MSDVPNRANDPKRRSADFLAKAANTKKRMAKDATPSKGKDQVESDAITKNGLGSKGFWKP